MPPLDIDGLQFDFPEGWQVSKYDEWSFYRNQFAKQQNGIKAVDALALSPDQKAFLIEVKDYRHPDTEKPSQLPEAIANKVMHTLAALLPARLYANEPGEKAFSNSLLGCRQLSVVVHVEQPAGHRPKVDLADLKQKIKRLLRAIDPHPKIVCMQKPQGVAWTVSS